MQVTTPTTYFGEEGRVCLEETLRLSFAAASELAISTLVIFTAQGDGLRLAADEYLSQDAYKHIRVIGVTFPHDTRVNSDAEVVLHQFSQDVRAELRSRGIPVVSANLPFRTIVPAHQSHGMLAQDMSVVGNALNVFGGGMSLCIQAVLLACDAGELNLGEHVIALTADTALVVRAAPTRGFLTDLIVRQLICKPAFLTISKNEEPALSKGVQVDGESPRMIEGTRDLEPPQLASGTPDE